MRMVQIVLRKVGVSRYASWFCSPFIDHAVVVLKTGILCQINYIYWDTAFG